MSRRLRGGLDRRYDREAGRAAHFADRMEDLEDERVRIDEVHAFGGRACHAHSSGAADGPKKGSGPFCAKHPSGRSGKRVLTRMALKLL